MVIFNDRFDAAQHLIQKLMQYKNNKDVVILAVPRGGLELGYVLARELHAPLDVVLSKKIGAPGNSEYAIGAVSLESIVIDPEFLDATWQPYVQAETERLRAILREQWQAYHGDQQPIALHNKVVILVDDGIATGKTFFTALELIKKQQPQKIVAALPVAPADAAQAVRANVDEFVCLETPATFFGISQFYKNFAQVEDERAIELLRKANEC